MPDMLSLSIMICSQRFKLVVTNVAEYMKGISLVSLWNVFSLSPVPLTRRDLKRFPSSQHEESNVTQCT